MNIENAVITAILALGIVGSAALASGGRVDRAERETRIPAISTPAYDDAVGISNPTILSDSTYQLFSI